MRQVLVTVSVALAAVALLWYGSDGLVVAQRPTGVSIPNANSAGQLITHSVTLEDGRQQLCVVDALQQRVAVYHIDPKTGSLQLKSVRNIHWDLKMEEFNTGGNPSPKEIRTLVEQR